MICEQCQSEGEQSRVIEEGTETTCIGFGPFYDQQGRHHSHDPNNHCTYYRCSFGHRWQRHWKAECPECGKWWEVDLVKTKPSAATVSATETLREALWKQHLRLAQYPELQGQTYVLECRVCGEVTQMEHWQQIVGDCCICHIPWHKAAPTFYVLLPDSVPVQEE